MKKFEIDRNLLFSFAEKFLNGFLNEDHPFLTQTQLRKNLRIYNAFSLIFILLLTLLLPRILVNVIENLILILILIFYLITLLSLIFNYLTKFKYFYFSLNIIIIYKLFINFFIMISVPYELPPVFITSLISNMILIHLVYNRWISFFYIIILLILMLYNALVYKSITLNASYFSDKINFFYDFAFSSILIWVLLEVYEHFREELEWKLLKNKQQQEKDIALAAELQLQMNPVIKKMKNYFLDYKIIPYDKVSGDIVEIIESTDGFWIVLGDVTGHGLHSGMLAMGIHSLFNYLVKEKELKDIYEIFIQLNNHFYHTISKLNIKNYSDLKVIKVNDSGIIEVAGSLSNMFYYNYKKNRLSRFKKEWVFLLGLKICNDKNQIPYYRFHLNEKDCLILCTDGAIETLFNSSNQFSIYQTVKELKNNLSIIESGLDNFFNFFYKKNRNIKVQDDITLMVIQYLPQI